MNKRSLEELKNSYDKVKSFICNHEELDKSPERKQAVLNLFNYLENETPWLSQFASTRFHCSYEGGLIEHSINVVNAARALRNSLYSDLNEWEVVFTAFLHDCGKAFEYARKPQTERQKQFGYPGSMGINTDVPYMTHEDRGLWMITRYYPYLTESMYCAIAMHNEPHLTNVSQFKLNRMMTLIQTADYYACLYMDAPGESY